VNHKHFIMAALLMGAAAPVAAQSVKSGIEAWQHSDYEAAVKIWRPLAEQGDPDAQFNLAQAYRLGRGVPTNLAAAQIWLERAAVQGHVDAQTTLGLLLFQSGDRAGAVKWLKAAAEKDDARALLVYGTALFNGDTVTQDAALGYAYVSRAAAQGLTPAKATLAQMNQVISAADRKKAVALIAEQKAIAKVASAKTPGAKAVAAKAETKPASQKEAALGKSPSTKTVAETAKSENATAEKSPVEKPASANAVGEKAVAEKAVAGKAAANKASVKAVAEKTRSAAKTSTPEKPAAASQAKAPGSWRIQLGAFSQRSSAEALFRKLSSSAPLSGRSASYSAAGAMTRLQVGPFATKAAADDACRALSARGQPCFPVPGK
jgi:cell division protein FtsN